MALHLACSSTLLCVPSEFAGSSQKPTSVVDKWDLWSQEVVLRGANMYQQEDGGDPNGISWYPTLVKEDLTDLAAAGANYVNLSIPGPFNVEEPFECNSESWKMLKKIADWSEQANLFVVIAFQTGPGRGEGDITPDEGGLKCRTVFGSKAEQDRYIAMWRAVAREYKDSKHVAAYDIMVEPHAEDGASVGQIAKFRRLWRKFAKRIVLGIRSVDDRTPIIVNLDEYSAASALEGWKPLFRGSNPKKIVFAVHQYAPIKYTDGKPDIPFESDFSSLKSAFKKIEGWEEKYPKHPIVVNEFGVRRIVKKAPKFLAKEYGLLECHRLNHAVWIWEVRDVSYTYRVFDVTQPELRHVVEANWKSIATPLRPYPIARGQGK